VGVESAAGELLQLVFWFSWPLLVRDRLVVPVFGCLSLFLGVANRLWVYRFCGFCLV
jgi:hypothetical protein